MSTITPIPQQTVINLHKGVSWDRSYKNIRWFDSIEQRDQWLDAHRAGQWVNCSVPRPGQVVLEGKYMDYIDCDYMDFFNPIGLGHQHVICAFVTSVDYVNANAFAVTYEIDWIMSYFKEIIFEPCFVIQHHVNDDVPGRYPDPEPYDIGEPQSAGVTKFMFTPTILTTTINMDNVLQIRTTGGVASAARVDVWSTGPLADYLNSLKAHPEYVPYVCMGVSAFGEPGSQAQPFDRDYSIDAPTLEFFRPGDSLSAYTAVNNKLKCYPYKFITADNYNGQVEQYHYEDFAGLAPKFKIKGMPLPKPYLICYPYQYKNSSAGNYDQQAIVYDAFPQVGWVSDTYIADLSHYVAQPIQTIGSTLTLAVKGGAGGALIAAGATAASIAGTYADYRYDQKTLHSKQYLGGTSAGAINFAMSNVGFRVTAYQIRPDIARRIDRMMTRYGYTVNEYTTPNITGRATVNYVKTADANISGNIPLECKEAMERALNSGVSFWHTDNVTRAGDIDNHIIGVTNG